MQWVKGITFVQTTMHRTCTHEDTPLPSSAQAAPCRIFGDPYLDFSTFHANPRDDVKKNATNNCNQPAGMKLLIRITVSVCIAH